MGSATDRTGNNCNIKTNPGVYNFINWNCFEGLYKFLFRDRIEFVQRNDSKDKWLVNRKSTRKVTLLFGRRLSERIRFCLKRCISTKNYFYRRNISNVALYRTILETNLPITGLSQVQVKIGTSWLRTKGQHAGPNNRSKIVRATVCN